MRKQINLVGTITASFSLDPKEFYGMTVPQITNEVLRVAESMHSNAHFFLDDAVEIANELATSVN